MPFAPRRMVRRTARRTSRRQMSMQGGGDQSAEQTSAPPPPEAAPAPAAVQPAEPDYTAELEELAKLHDQGILTDEEFEAKKRQVLEI